MERTRQCFRPRFEPLEDRAQPSVFTVVYPVDVTDSFGNGYPGTFRWAIQQANQHPNSQNPDWQWDEIQFKLPGTSPFVITLQQPLDPVTDPVIVDGSTQPGLDAANGEVITIVVPVMPDLASQENMQLINVWIRPNVIDWPIDVIVVTPNRPKVPTPVPTPDPIDPLIPRTLTEDQPVPPTPTEIATLDAFFIPPKPLEDLPTSRPSPPPLGASGSDVSIFLPGDQVQTGKIMGMLFEDYDGNGIRSADEPPAVGRVVYLDLNHNGRLDDGEPTAVTNEKGEYRFEYLRPGNYQVEQVLWPHLVQTLPKEGGNVVDLAPGEVIMDVDFGAVKVQKRRVPVSIPDGDSRLPAQPEAPPSRPLGGLLFAAGVILQQRPPDERKKAA